MTATDAPVLELTGERTPVRALLRDVVAHRDLLLLLARHDYRARYRSASLGLVWSVTLPLLQGLVIAIVFSKLVGGDQARTYVPYVIAGMAAWAYVQQSVAAASTSIVDSGAIAGRIYFPRMLLAAIPATANLPGFAISLTLAEVIVLVTLHTIDLTLLALPALVALSWLFVVSLGWVTSMAHVYSRDVRYIVQAMLLVLFYATPVIYGLSDTAGRRALPESLRPYVLANPATGLVQLGRWCVTGHADYLGTAVAWTAGWTVALVLLAVWLYSRFERVAVDRL